MRILGISEGSHDACWALIEDGEILEAHHQERHDRIKNSKWLDPKLLPERDVTVSHQRLGKVNERRKWAGQDPIEYNIIPDFEYEHHETHAWAGWSTAPFEDCDILTIDAIGEWDTATVHTVRNKIWKKTWGMKYPKSYGLPYSLVTNQLGLKPMRDEYITMALAPFGLKSMPHDGFQLDQMAYLFMGYSHTDNRAMHPDVIYLDPLETRTGLIDGVPRANGRGGYSDKELEMAYNVQRAYEMHFIDLIDRHCHHDNLIIMGGCALNCVANTKVEGKNIWIMPNPGDGGSALGAAARHYGKQLNWKGPYLGTEMPEMNPDKIVNEILGGNIAAVASGRAEYGPRALGNRSLLADPLMHKKYIDKIKSRSGLRPFAPAILEEHFDHYFDGPKNEYMQMTPRLKNSAATVPGWSSVGQAPQSRGHLKNICHIDKTSRVQVVTKDCSSVLRKVLELYYKATGIPMLLNTSLNMKNSPIVDNMNDYKDFIGWSGLNDIS